MTDDRESGEEKMARYMSRPDAGTEAEATRKAERAVRGFQCPNCHCNNFAVDRTIAGHEHIKRYRVCRVCGCRIHTDERRTL